MTSRVNVYWYMKKVMSSLFSVALHTLILIHNNTHTLKRKENTRLHSVTGFPYTNINIHTGAAFRW